MAAGRSSWPTAFSRSMGSGAYLAGQLVTISTTTPGATITYSINGSEPTANDPTERRDPRGAAMTFAYDAQFRLVAAWVRSARCRRSSTMMQPTR